MSSDIVASVVTPTNKHFEMTTPIYSTDIRSHQQRTAPVKKMKLKVQKFVPDTEIPRQYLDEAEPRQNIETDNTSGEVRVKTQRNQFTVKYGGSLWSNPSRTCPKIAGYYHNKLADFNQRNLTDDQAVAIENKALLLAKGHRALNHRQESRARTANRKFERQSLQFRSNQATEAEQIEEIENLVQTDPNKFQWVSVRTLQSLKDPSKGPICGKEWKLLSQQPTNFVKGQIPDILLKGDKWACEQILEKLEIDKYKEAQKKQQVQEKRRVSRERLVQRHELHIASETRSGIYREYVPLDEIFSNQCGSEFYLSPKAESIKMISQLNNRKNSGNTVSNTGLHQGQEDQKSMMSTHNRISGEGLQTAQVIQRPFSSPDQGRARGGRYGPENQAYANDIINSESQRPVSQYTQSAFRVNKRLQRRYYGTSRITQKLQSPKMCDIIGDQQPFLNSDFRGLVHTDLTDALHMTQKSCNNLASFQQLPQTHLTLKASVISQSGIAPGEKSAMAQKKAKVQENGQPVLHPEGQWQFSQKDKNTKAFKVHEEDAKAMFTCYSKGASITQATGGREEDARESYPEEQGPEEDTYTFDATTPTQFTNTGEVRLMQLTAEKKPFQMVKRPLTSYFQSQHQRNITQQLQSEMNSRMDDCSQDEGQRKTTLTYSTNAQAAAMTQQIVFRRSNMQLSPTSSDGVSTQNIMSSTPNYPGTAKHQKTSKAKRIETKLMNDEIEDFFKRTQTSHRSTNMLSRHDLACFKSTGKDTMHRLKEKFAYEKERQKVINAQKTSSSIERLNMSMEASYKGKVSASQSAATEKTMQQSLEAYQTAQQSVNAAKNQAFPEMEMESGEADMVENQ